MTAGKRGYATFSPTQAAGDTRANYWLRQAMLRLRREVCWAWRERTGGAASDIAAPLTDRLSDSLDRVRYWKDKQRFFETDPTARYLSEQIEAEPPRRSDSPERGTFEWVEREAPLNAVDAFALGLGLLAAFDSAAEPVFAACNNDATRPSPTLALVQRLWDTPEDTLTLSDSGHALFRYGLLRKMTTPDGSPDWNAPLHVPDLVARRLLFPATSRHSQPRQTSLRPHAGPSVSETVRTVALRLRAHTREMRIVPLRLAFGAPAADVVAQLGAATGRTIVEVPGTVDGPGIAAAVTLAWLDDIDVVLNPAWVRDKTRLAELVLPLASAPVTVFVVDADGGALDGIPPRLQIPPIEMPPLDYAQRIEIWRRALGTRAEALAPAIAEASRRFRYEAGTIEQIADGLCATPGAISASALTASCRAASRIELGDMAQRVTPRFDSAKELFLPAPQRMQFEEVLRAMRALTEVHYRWGTARVWNEAGISVLFAGAPGTGKTMAAEVLASELDLPMYRIDLSQVVNKYIGETEKNLKRIFDAADVSDALLLFDEADAIFGKRMEARDAHDRYANLEISYLLDRMERFKGLAVLATNRKKDLDEAFLRRLRYIIEFPLPGAGERLQIWEQSLPHDVDTSDLDLRFLADAFPLAGGHIRSIVFNACLQSAGRSDRPALRMEEVLVAVKRELDKTGRAVGLEAFGAHAPLIRSLDP
jgi:hypothetical protein